MPRHTKGATVRRPGNLITAKTESPPPSKPNPRKDWIFGDEDEETPMVGKAGEIMDGSYITFKQSLHKITIHHDHNNYIIYKQEYNIGPTTERTTAMA